MNLHRETGSNFEGLHLVRWFVEPWILLNSSVTLKPMNNLILKLEARKGNLLLIGKISQQHRQSLARRTDIDSTSCKSLMTAGLL